VGRRRPRHAGRARPYAERIPDATLRVIEDCGHAMYFERPDAFADAVTEFLEAGS
jgi:pimeloyl-ACP methyl ester carboxylesterase